MELRRCAPATTKLRGVQIAAESDDWSQYFPVPEYKPPAEEPPVSQITLRDIAETGLPGLFFGRLAAEHLREGDYSQAAMWGAAAILDIGAAAVTVGADEGEAAALRLAAKRAAQLKVNSAAGRVFEREAGQSLAEEGVQIGAQVTAKTKTGRKGRLDFLTRDPNSAELGCIECKGSTSAPVRPKQQRFFNEIEEGGGTVVGNGKPGFEGGTLIPPTRVRIIRPTRGPK